MEGQDTRNPLKPKKQKSFKFLHKREKDEKEEKRKEKVERRIDKRKEKEERRKEKEEKKRFKKEKKKKEEEEEEVPVFGVPLDLAVQRCPSHDGVLLPAIVRECIDQIEQRGLYCEGIYRLSGVKSKVHQLKRLYNAGETVKLSDQEPHVIASLLKQFLRELPEPVLTVDMMPHFEDVAMIPNPGERAEAMRQLIDHLPTTNRLLLQYMFKHMGHIIARERDTKMTYQNVSIVLSPTMQISHRVLNVFFLNHAGLFGGVTIKRYIPPIGSSSSGGSGERSLEQLQSVVEIEVEMMKQESLLAHLHAQVTAGNVSRSKEERLWEAQRIVTLLKRKLRSAQRREEEERIRRQSGVTHRRSEALEKESTSEECECEPSYKGGATASEDSSEGSGDGLGQRQKPTTTITTTTTTTTTTTANTTTTTDNTNSSTVDIDKPMSGAKIQGGTITTTTTDNTTAVNTTTVNTTTTISTITINNTTTTASTLPDSLQTKVIVPGGDLEDMEVKDGEREKSGAIREEEEKEEEEEEEETHIEKEVLEKEEKKDYLKEEKRGSETNEGKRREGIGRMERREEGELRRENAEDQQDEDTKNENKKNLPPAITTAADVTPHVTVIEILPQGTPGDTHSPTLVPPPRTEPPAPPRLEARRLAVEKVALRETQSLDDTRVKDKEQLALLAQEVLVVAEHEELLSMNHDLMRKLQAERAEITRLREEIQEMQTLYGYRTYSYDSSESDGSESERESDTEEEMVNRLSHVTRANRTLQEENRSLTRRIQEEREAVVQMRVWLQLAQWRELSTDPPMAPVC